MTQDFVSRIDPKWQSKLQPIKLSAVHAFGKQIIPVGLYPTRVIFPHPRGSIRLACAFLILNVHGPTPVLIGSNLMAMYGIDLVSSKGRFMTIGKSNARFALQVLSAPAMPRDVEVMSVVRTEDDMLFLDALKAASFPESMPKEDYQKMEDMLVSVKRAFAYGDRQLGECKQDIDKILDELLELGVVRPSNSEYASPVVMVYKDGKPRLCVNYKALNDHTKAFLYPLPKIDESLGMLKEAKYISTLDMNKGFHQCWVDEESIKYTAFSTHRGLFEYVRMPFGLKNAPAHFQQCMDGILGGILREGWAKVYIDDIVVFSRSLEEHIEHIR